MKKIFIMSAGIIVFLALLLSGWLYFRGNKLSNKSDNVSQSARSVYVPQLDTAENIWLKDPANEQQIKDGINKFQSERPPVNKSSSLKDFYETVYRGTSGESVTLDNFSRASNLTIFPAFKKNIDQNNFSTIYCLNGNQKNYGLIFNVKHSSSGEYIDFSNVARAMNSWEKTMLRDLHGILFPEASFADEQLSQKVNFGEGKYRFAEIVLPDGSKSSINYKIFGSQIVVTSSLECLDKVSNYFSSFD